MTWLLNHKLFVLFLAAAAIFWFGNPSGQFGFVRKGVAIYNHIPVLLLDCYVAPDGRLYPESRLDDITNVNYWFEQHFTSYQNPGTAAIPLIIGSGFSDSSKIAIGPQMLQACRQRQFEPHMYLSPEAIEKFNAYRNEGKPAALLLKLQ